MTGLLSPLLILIAGALGGLVNAFITENGFVLPTAVATGTPDKVWRPGILGNVAVSAVAALVSWGLYGAGASVQIFAPDAAAKSSLTYSALVGAILVGIGGARWLTSEVDKNLLRGAAVAAADSQPSRDLMRQMATASPAGAFNAATRQP